MYLVVALFALALFPGDVATAARSLGGRLVDAEHDGGRLTSFTTSANTGWSPEPTPWFGVRLALGSSPLSMSVTWSTRRALKPCLTYWQATNTSGGPEAAVMAKAKAAAAAKVVEACGSRSSKVVDTTKDHFVNTVTLRNLVPGVRYGYSVAMGQQSEFVAPVMAPNVSISHGTRLLVLGDLGVLRSLTMPDLIKEVQSIPGYDAILHVGDLAYDLHDLGGGRAEQFLNLIHPLSSRVPYMVCPGNHEAAQNFSLYKSLFTMPNRWPTDTENLFYSFDIGLVHVVMYNTEVFFWPDSFGQSHMKRMFEWMKKDLEAANARRNIVPWIVVVGHRPMYCQHSVSSYDLDNSSLTSSLKRCGWEAEASRSGIPSDCPHDNPRACRPHRDNLLESWPIEELLHNFQVDVAAFGHVHCYQRHFPVYNYRTSYYNNNSSINNKVITKKIPQFVNPKAPIHIVTGAAGNSEMSIGKGIPSIGACDASAPWCAFQSGCVSPQRKGYDFSYSRATAHNATHMQWQQYSSLRGRVIDEWWIIRL